MRFYIRNKTKYDPSVAFSNPVIAVNVDHTQEITKIKEEARKLGKGCKITALYVARQDGTFIDLADDRTINYYNLQDGMILETTSNPFWVTTLYSNMRRREQEAASNPEDARLCFQAQKSYIHRCMAIGLLLNGTGETEKQPDTFHALEDLYEYCLNQGKKPAYMSQFTLEELQEMFETFQDQYQHHRDPIGGFIYSQAVKLGYLQENNTVDGNDPFRSHYEQTGQQQRVVPAGRNGGQNRNGGGGGGRRRANRNRTCNDCEAAMATSYCADCNPPLCLCDVCWRSLHRGATRRNHQMKDISKAPTPTSYTPQAYRAPFAMLVAFHRALQERPQKGSLTAEDIKTRAQPFTDTDLEEAKQRGKPFSGFDSLENALMKNNIVLKEAAETPKYSLLESGKELALKCSNFDFAVQALLQQAEVPTIPVPAVRPAFFNNRQVCLLVDTEEPLKDRFVKVARERGLSAKVRKLPSGDFCWILLPPGAQANNPRDIPEQELVLPYLVERKTWDDLWSSVRSPRFENQVQRMKGCGIENLFYLVEGSPKDINGRPGPEVEAFLQGKLDRLLLEDNFFVNRTPSWLKTVEWLCHLTNLAVECQQAGVRKQWMTFAEFSRTVNNLPVGANITRNAKPVNGIVWSASDFANSIKSHYKQERDLGSGLDHIPQLSKSILVIQGLTAYNTNSSGHLKKALADYLRVPGQTAEECVQIHLEDYTDQLVSINVFQYYVLYLEVFKGIRIFRTETHEETEEFLSRFNAKEITSIEVKGDPRRADKADDRADGVKNKPIKQAAEKVEDMMFANDSQEEEFMLQQALQQSLADENVQHNHDNRFGNDNGLDDYDDNGLDDDGDDDNTQHTISKEKERSNFNQSQRDMQIKTAKNCIDKNNNRGEGNKNGLSDRNIEKSVPEVHSSGAVNVKQEVEEETNDLEDILQFKFYDSLKGGLQDVKKDDKCESKGDSADEELHKIMEASKLEYEKEEKERKALLRSVYDEEEELRKAIELSRKDMEHNEMGGVEKTVNSEEKMSDFNGKGLIAPRKENDDDHEEEEEDCELYKVIKQSIKEAEDIQMVKETGNADFRNNFSSSCICSDEAKQLETVLKLSMRDSKQNEKDKPEKSVNSSLNASFQKNLSSLNEPNICSDDGQLKKVLELSKKDLGKNKEEEKSTKKKCFGDNGSDEDCNGDGLYVNKKSFGKRNTNSNGNESNYDNQEDEKEECFYDFEVPNFVHSETHDNSSTISSTSIFSSNNTSNYNKVSKVDCFSSQSANCSTSNQQSQSTSNNRISSSGVNDGDDDGDIGNVEAVLIDSQDMEEKEKQQDKESSNSKSNKSDSHNLDKLTTNDNVILVDSQDMEEDEEIALKFQKHLQKKASSFKASKTEKCSNNLSVCGFDDAILVDSQDIEEDEDIALKLQEEFDEEASSFKASEKDQCSNHLSSCIDDDAILVDSQDDVEVVDSTTDYEIAFQLQQELNQQANKGERNNREKETSTSNNIDRTAARNQIASYREEQQKRFRESKTGKSPKNMSPGLAFRQKAEAIARGKETLLSVVRPLGTNVDNVRRRPEKRGHDGTIKSWRNDSVMGRRNARKSCANSTSFHTETRNRTETTTSDTTGFVFPGSSPRPREIHQSSSLREQGSSGSSSSSGSLVFTGSISSPSGYNKQSTSTPKSSGSFTFPGSLSCSRDSSTSYKNDTTNSFVFPGSTEFSSSPRPSREADMSSCSSPAVKPDDSFKSSSSAMTIHGPKCSECGEIGHRKGTKRCPYYYTEEAQRKREQQTRKRKEKREEEERQLQSSIDAVAAEQLGIAEQAEQLRRQIEQFNRRNDNLPKVVEDAMKYLKKRRRK